MGGGFSSVSLPSFSNPFKGRNFSKGLGNGLRGGPRQTTRRTSTGSFFGQSTYPRRSVSSTPMTFSGILGQGIGHKLSTIGRTGTKPIYSNSSKPSFVDRIKDKSKNIENSNILQNQPFEQPPPQNQTQQLPQQNQNKQLPPQNQNQQPPPQNQNKQLPPQTKGGSKKKPSENKKNPSKKETNPSKKEKKPSKK